VVAKLIQISGANLSIADRPLTSSLSLAISFWTFNQLGILCLGSTGGAGGEKYNVVVG
jgi:hypothetical protein